MKKEEIRKELEKMYQNGRSVWIRGVALYAMDLLDEIPQEELAAPLYQYEVLNGASTFKAYSYGGCSLVCDFLIAERLCTPSELKRTRNGERQPNRSESWLDVQARALYQAYNLLSKILHNANN